MPTSTTCLKVAATCCGLALIVAQVLQNIEALGQAAVLSGGLGLAAIAVPVAMAIVVPVAQHQWSEGSYVSAFVAFVVLACGVSHTAVVALERGAHARDQLAASRTNVSFDLATKSHANAVARVREMEALVLAESRTGCKRGCEAAKAALDDARTQALKTQAALAQVGAPVDGNSMSRRFGYVAQVIDVWHPVLLPVCMELAGVLLLGFAFHRGKAPTTSQAVPALGTASKVDEAAEAIRKLRAEQGGKIGSIRVVSRRIGHSHGTTQRALKSAAN